MGAEPEKKWAHVLRWYKHIASFGDASASWAAPAVSTAAGAAAAEASTGAAATEDEDLDLFGEETEEEKAANEARKKAAEAKPKAGPIAKSAVILDVKPWGEETDMAELEKLVREITHEGLEWKAAKLIEIAFGIKKLQIMCHVVDDAVSVDEDIIRVIEALEDHVQSVDIFAFNKL